MVLDTFQTSRLFVQRTDSIHYNSYIATLQGDDYYQYAVIPDMSKAAEYGRHFYYAAYPIGSNEWLGLIKGYYTEDNKSVWIQNFLIVKSYSRQGFGTELFHSLIKDLSKQPVNNLYLSVMNDNTQGTEFWRKNGFLPIKYLEKSIYHKKDGITIYSRLI